MPELNTETNTDGEFTIEGIKTTIPFHRQVMRNEKFQSGNFDTSFLETFQFFPEEV